MPDPARPDHAALMERALVLAAEAAGAGEVPVGAVIWHEGRIVAEARNEMVGRRDPTAHAELLVLQRALAALTTDRLRGATLAVTLEPCAQCAGAIVLARVDQVVFGAWDDKAGMAGSVGDLLRHPRLNHTVEVRAGVLADRCGALLSEFFRQRRAAG